MTVVVTFFCPDGVVVAADSMLTPSLGPTPIGSHRGRKVYADGHQLFAWAGDLGLAMRFKTMVDANPVRAIGGLSLPLDYGLRLSEAINKQFAATGAPTNGAVNAVVAFVHDDQACCCAFVGNMQPHVLDPDHYYAALGTGKLAADPFLRFLVDIFCANGRPTVREAVFLATWTVQHAIDTSPGGVDGPIRVAVLERSSPGWASRELPESEIYEHHQALESARAALREWRDGIQTGAAASAAPNPPLLGG